MLFKGIRKVHNLINYLINHLNIYINIIISILYYTSLIEKNKMMKLILIIVLLAIILNVTQGYFSENVEVIISYNTYKQFISITIIL